MPQKRSKLEIVAYLYPLFLIAYVVIRYFSGIDPLTVRTEWTTLRNIGYIGHVVVFLAIGLIQLLTTKRISQRLTTYTVFSLFLTTFSYAIGALIIDVVRIIYYLFTRTTPNF